LTNFFFDVMSIDDLRLELLILKRLAMVELASRKVLFHESTDFLAAG